MKKDNFHKRSRLHDIAIEKAFQREKQGFFEGAALAFIEAANLLPENKYAELVVSCLNNAATSYFQCKTDTPAEKCLHRALNISEKHLEHENSFLALTLHHLGLFYTHNEDLDKAENYYCQALRIRKKILGDEHPDTSVTLNNLGGLYLRKKELDKAEDYYQQALKIREKTLGKNHPKVASILSNLSSIYQRKNDLSKAQEYNQLAKNSTEKSLNSDDKIDAIVDINAYILKQEIERLEREKLEMKAALHQADRLSYLGRMATMMAHNIKNPVNNITTATVSMLMGIKNKGITAEQLVPSLERILNNSDRLNKIIENFRNFAQGDRTTFSNINLNETIEDIFQLLFVGQYQNHQIKLIRNFSEKPVMAKTNSFAMQEILITLLNNAKEVLSNKESNQVTISTWQNSNKVGFDVEDNGGGIEESKRDKLFSPFFSSKNSGMGLGLYFCKEILKDLEGNIEYYPAPHGAGFRVTLPIATELENGTQTI